MATQRNRHFRSHVIVWFLLVAGIVLSVTGFSIYQNAESYLFKRYVKQQALVASMAASLIDGDSHRRLTSARTAKNKTFSRINKALKQTLRNAEFPASLYTLNVDLKNNTIRYGFVPNNTSEKGSLDQALESGKVLKTDQQFKERVIALFKKADHDKLFSASNYLLNGRIESLAIIQDKKGRAAGVVVIEASELQVSDLKQHLLESMLVTLGLLFIALLVASILFARKITAPFEKLTDAIERLIKNDFNFHLSLSDFGGFTDIAKQFNLMLLKLQVSRNELVSTNRAYSRFVPHQVLKLISPTGIKNVSLGDCVEKEMTILFCDIRGFTSISESMPPKESFRFINNYLKLMVPVINKQGGTVDKFMGDGIMALFPNSADYALKAAIGMMETLAKYNQKMVQNKLPRLEIGIGIHTGNMMLGTVGNSARMDVTVVSDTVNAAARVESLTKTFHAPILISEETRVHLEKFDKRNLRFMATCRVKGKSNAMTIYEVFSQDDASLRVEKLANQDGMIRGWNYYKNGETENALATYQKLMDRSPLDKAPLALIEVVQRGRL